MTKRNLIVFIAVAIILFFVYSFFQIENNENVVLSPIESFQINVPEPSGLYNE